MRPSWKREHVALGTNTDPYQWVEGRYKLMPGIWEAMRDSADPWSVLTKSPLLLRDIDLMKEVHAVAVRGEPLDPHARGEGMARDRAAHAESARADRGGGGAEPGGHPDRRPHRSAHAGDQRLARSRSRRSSSSAARPARSTSAGSRCTCAARCAGSSSSGSARTARTSCRATSSSTRAARTSPGRSASGSRGCCAGPGRHGTGDAELVPQDREPETTLETYRPEPARRLRSSSRAANTGSRPRLRPGRRTSCRRGRSRTARRCPRARRRHGRAPAGPRRWSRRCPDR